MNPFEILNYNHYNKNYSKLRQNDNVLKVYSRHLFETIPNSSEFEIE